MKSKVAESLSFHSNADHVDVKGKSYLLGYVVETAIHCGLGDSIDTDIVFINSSTKLKSKGQWNSGFISNDSNYGIKIWQFWIWLIIGF